MAEKSEITLSAGSIRSMHDQVEDDPIAVEPIVQVLSVKKVSSTNGVDRYRLIVSDGVHFMQAMLATQLNDLVHGNPPVIEKNSIIKLVTYACNIVQGRRIIIGLTVDPVSGPVDKIGAQVTDVTGGAAAAAPAPAAAAAPAGRGGSNASSTSAATKKAPAKKSGGAPIYPIEGLSPYQNKWTIKARVTTKSEIKHWSNAKGDGKLFNVNLLDDTGEIKATGFNEACDNLYSIFEEGKVYYISKARVNIAKKQFSNLTNEYEIMFENSTEVSLCEDQESAPQVKYNFIEIGNLADQEKDSTCDVLGIVKDNGDLTEITAKATQKQIKKRELTVCDRSGFSVRVTLWGRSAETWQEADNAVYAFKGAKVGDFGGRTLSMGGQSTMTADPDVPEAHALRGWYDTEGQTTAFQSFSNAGGMSNQPFKKDEFKTLEQVKTEELGMSDNEKPDYFSVRATIMFVKNESMWYPACPSDKCNKKVTMEDTDAWRCEKCDMVYPAPEYRYVLSFSVADHTNQVWLSGFNDIGLLLLSQTADSLEALKNDDDAAFQAIVKGASGRMYNFGCRAKAESYNDQKKVRYQCLKASPIEWVGRARELLDEIDRYGA